MADVDTRVETLEDELKVLKGESDGPGGPPSLLCEKTRH